MLHIHNGDSTANTGKRSSVPGEHFAWRESLITGPTPSGLSEEEWRRVRAQHLAEAYGVNAEECESGLLSQEQTLSSLSQHDELVLWFEHDLFCQLQLLYLLNWFGRHDLGETKLSLVCIGEFSGRENFRGLGELTSEELSSLFPARQHVNVSQLNLATSAWTAYCSADPNDIQKLLRTDTSALPFLSAALRAHLKRFPSTKNGLGHIENRALQLIDSGIESFSELFSKFGETEPIYGLGDAQFWLSIRRMTDGGQPLLEVDRLDNEQLDRQLLKPEIVNKAKFRLTEFGKVALRGEADCVSVTGVDFWLGGVNLSESKNLWRWNEESGLVIPSGPR